MESAKKHSQLALPLRSLNHVSRVCRDIAVSAAFYRDVLGFIEIKRPESFDFEGSWLFNYNIGIHLIKGEPPVRRARINPKSDHLSFQSDNLREVEQKLKLSGIDYVKATVEESGVRISQIFFHDPDNNMIEICNCDCLPVVPLSDITALRSDCTTKPGGCQAPRQTYKQINQTGDKWCNTSHPIHKSPHAVCSGVV